MNPPATPSPATPRALARQIVERLHTAGFGAFWVGGSVRDFLLGREPQDFDIATDAKPEQVEVLFEKTIPVGKKFGVMIVLLEGHQFQVATFRAEADYRDGRRPETVVFANAQADAVRRDFTVNGLFYDPLAEKIHDWVGGENDLRAGIIRTIGDAEARFSEDHLRLLRAVRFAARLGFEIEPQTFAAIQKLAPRIAAISAERIRDELLKLFAPPSPESSVVAPAARGLRLLHETGLLAHVLPELVATVTCEQTPDFHPEGSVFNHISLMLEKLPAGADDLLPWAVLLHDIAKPLTARHDPATGRISFYTHEVVGAEMTTAIMRRLKFPNHTTDSVTTAVRHHMQFKDVKQMRKATLRRMFLRPTFPLELELHRLDCLGSSGNLEHYDFARTEWEIVQRQPALLPQLLSGHDLLSLGVTPGRAIGKFLHDLRDKQLAEEITTAKAAREWVQTELARTKSC